MIGLVPQPPYIVPTTMIDVVKHLGLQSSLVLTLDASDAASYDGSSQTWTDVSGNSNNFYRGSGSGSDGTDPTFNGVAGRQASTEYFSADGGDGFWESSDLSFMNAWHKDGATFSVLAWMLAPSGAAQPPGNMIIRNYFNTGAAADEGISVQANPLSNDGKLKVTMFNGSSGVAFAPASANIVEGSWMLAAVSFSEGSGASFSMVNGAASLLTSDTYVSPSATDPAGGVTIWGSPDAAGTALYTGASNGLAPNGARLNSVMAWSRALSQAEVTAFYTATKAKFGL